MRQTSASALLGAALVALIALVIALLLVLVIGAGLLALTRTLLVLLLVLCVLRLVGLFMRTSAALGDAGVVGIGAALLATGVGVVLVLLRRRALVAAGLLLACVLTLAGLLAALLVLLILLLIFLRLILLSLVGLLLLTVVLLIGHVILLVIRSLEDAGGLDRRSVGEKPSCLQVDAVPIGARRIRLWADMPAAVSGLLTRNAWLLLFACQQQGIHL
jgi:hypothetical protein